MQLQAVTATVLNPVSETHSLKLKQLHTMISYLLDHQVHHAANFCEATGAWGLTIRPFGLSVAWLLLKLPTHELK
jgi:hypothetical protein